MKLAFTLGDCSGISPEITLKALTHLLARDDGMEYVIYGSRAVLDDVRTQLKLPDPLCSPRVNFAPPNPAVPSETDLLIAARTPIANALCGEAAYQWVRQAAQDALRGEVDGIVTAPFNKEAIHCAGHAIPGHTELLAEVCHAQTGVNAVPCMAFYSSNLMMSLATIHEAISRVPSLITYESLSHVFDLTIDAVTKLRGHRPRVGVLSLNPHAGEAGAFGNEEAETIVPVMQAFADRADCIGPIVPDTAFTWMMKPNGTPPVDVYIAMYHDQGLIPFKTYAFDRGVNITLGLPLVRTSPDHGTAFDIARQNIASEQSMIEATDCAVKLITVRRT